MSRMKIKDIYILCLLGVLFFSCYEDKGNYNYEDVNQLKIQFTDEVINCIMGDTLEIVPIYKFTTDSSHANLTYEWSFLDSVISTERNLNYILPEKTINEYVYLRVFDHNTNVSYISQVFLQITSLFQAHGWIVLSEKEGKSCLSMIREEIRKDQYGSYYYSYDDYLHVFEKMNGYALGTKPVKTLEHYSGEWGAIGQHWIIQQGEGGCIDVSGTTFKKDIRLEETFLNGLPANFQPVDMIDTRWLTLIVNANGDVYTRKKLTDKLYNSGYFLSDPLEFEGEKVDGRNMVLAPFADFGFTLFYDKQHNRFLSLISRDEVSAGQIIAPEVYERYYADKPHFSRLYNFKNKKILHTGYYDVSGGYDLGFYSILQDTEGNLYTHDFTIYKNIYSTSAPVATPVDEIKVDFRHVIDGTSKNVFRVIRYNKAPYILISKNNELWYYDRISKGEIKKYYTFDADICAIDYNIEDGTRVCIALENGKYHIMNFDRNTVNFGDETKRLKYSSSSDFGKIVDLKQKVLRQFGWSWQQN